MAWIEMHQALLTHRKVRRVSRLLNIPCTYVCGHLFSLWAWALDNAQDGRIEADDIADAAGYGGPPQEFLAALMDAGTPHGFIEQHEDGTYWLHDWGDWGGELLRKRYIHAARVRHINANKKTVMVRDGYTCRYCGATSNLSIDHIVPITRGGGGMMDNLVTACKKCNSSKNNKTPEEWRGGAL